MHITLRPALAGTLSVLFAGATLAGSASELAKLTASDGSSDAEFGESIVIQGQTIVVGASDAGGTGQAYVYAEAGGLWTEDIILVGSDSVAGDLFGVSVDMDGNRIVVGAQWADPSGTINAGAAYVFVNTGSGWVEEAKLEASDAADFDWFGKSVAISGGTVAVGAPFKDVGGNFAAGAAYVYTLSAGTWSEQQKITASDATGSDFFGWSVALDGDTLLVGSEFDDDNGADSGSAYVFDRVVSTWSETTKLLASDGAADDQFGVSVALDGDTAVVGAIKSPFMAPCCTGAAYVFDRVAGNWGETQILVPGDAGIDDQVGVAVAIDGPVIVVGAWMAEQQGLDSGTAYAFELSGGTWTESVELVPSDLAAGDWFGAAVSVWGETIAVGAVQEDDVALDAGAAYVFPLDPAPGTGTCFGVGCPCGNDDPTAGCGNSTGSGGRLDGTGTASVSNDNLVLTASDLPPNNNGLFYMGDTLVSSTFFDGIQCALGTTFRFLGSIQNSGAAGTMTYTGFVADSGIITAGSTWHFHCWHRDANGPSPCGTGANLTHIYSVTFTP